jgi:hypothetical protein
LKKRFFFLRLLARIFEEYDVFDILSLINKYSGVSH